jgi:hypothetical protein
MGENVVVWIVDFQLISPEPLRPELTAAVKNGPLTVFAVELTVNPRVT